jgi:hypothetical protein
VITSRVRVLAVALAGLAILLSGLTVPATAATTSSLLAVDLTGVFADGDATRSPSRSVAVGTVSSGWKADGTVQTSNYGFDFTANCSTVGGASTCAALAGAGKTLYWHWDFGDGRTRTTNAPTPGAPVTYTKPGTYTVRVTVDNTPAGGAVPADAYAGTSELRVIVAPRFADADASNGTKKSPTNAESMWAVAALGLLEPCGVFLPTNGQALSNATPGDPGRALFCPKAPSVNAVKPGGTVAPFTTNGVTGTNCLASASACGLPANAWSNNGLAATATCTAACVTELTSRGFLNTSGQVVYRDDVCGDNRTAGRDRSAVRGTENGCVTYGDFLTGLGRALDSSKNSDNSAELPTAGACLSAAPRGAQRAYKLLSGAPAAANRPGLVRMCDLDAAITKAEAYALVAAATGTSLTNNTAFLSGFRDLASGSPLNSSTTYSTGQMGEVLSGAAESGAPIVGDIECADRADREEDQVSAGVCFNGGETLFRDEASRLLGWLVLGENARTSDTRAEISPGSAVTTSGKPVSVDVKAYVPAWYPTDANVTVSWTGGSALNTITCPTYTASVGASRTATLRCTFTGASETGQTGQTFTATVRDDQGGNQATATFRAIVSNDAPVINAPTFSDDDDEGKTMNIMVPIDEPQGGLVRVGVRSCLPAVDGGCVTSGNTFDRNGNKTRTTSSDTNPSTFSTFAATDVGTVRVRDVTASTARLVVDPHDLNNNGPFDFVVQVCDTGNSCTSRYVRPTYRPVNDKPRTLGLIAATSDETGVDVVLGGTDTDDTTQPGYPSSTAPIGQYMLCAIPAGWNAFWVDGGTVTAATAGAPSTTNRVRLIPQSGVAAGSYSLRYNVRDNGQGQTAGDYAWAGGAGNCSGELGEIQLTSTAVWPGTPISATITPSTAPAHTGTVTMNVSNLSPGAAITVNWGDGTTTGPVNTPNVRHVYTSGSDTNYAVTYSVTDAGQTYNGTAGNVFVRANHVSEPTFETNAYQGWTSTASPLATVAGSGRNNSVGLRVSDVGDVDVQNDVYFARGRVIAGESYQARLWIRSTAPRTTNVTLTETGGGANSTGSVTLQTGWTEVVRTIASANATGGSLTLSITGADEGADMFIDDVSVTGTLSAPLFASFSQAVLDSNPYAYFPITPDDTASSVTDASPNGHTAKSAGQYEVSKRSLVSGGKGSLELLEGDELTLPLGPDLAPKDGDQATVSFWTQKSASSSWALDTSSQRKTNLSVRNDPTDGLSLKTQEADARTSWDHIAPGRHQITAVLTTGDATKTRLFVDGNPLAVSFEDAQDVTADLSVDALRLSARADNSDPVVVDEVAVFAGALTDDAILRHYQAGAGPAAAAVAADRPTLTLSGAVVPPHDAKGSEDLVSVPADAADSYSVESVLEDKPSDGLLWTAGLAHADVVGKRVQVTTRDGAVYSSPLRGLNKLGHTAVMVTVRPSGVRVYVNGSPVPVDLVTPGQDVQDATGEFRWSDTVSAPAERLDDGAVVRVYDRPLTARSAQRHYTELVSKALVERSEKKAAAAAKKK